MKIFVTGASGFIGSAVVNELIRTGHSVIGLARKEESAKIVRDAGAEVLMGGLEDLDVLKNGASGSDGVIHLAFIHDFTQYAKSAIVDKTAINAMGEVLQGTKRPLVVTAGILGLPLINGMVTEESMSKNSPRFSEDAALSLAEQGINASVVRLPPSVHDKGDGGFIPFIIQMARKNGVSAFPDEGKNRWPSVHRLDAAKLFRSAVEKSSKGALYNAIGDEGVETKQIAELIGKTLSLPVASLSGEELANHFTWMSRFIGFDSPATAFKTQERLGWRPIHIGLLEDMKLNYFN
jgi:nucleoside-diphosphate-sugar epimerase